MIHQNKYDIIEKLDQNAEFTLYRAADRLSSKVVLIRRYTAATLSSTEKEKLKRRHQCIRKLDSPFIVKIYDLIEEIDEAAPDVLVAYEDIAGVPMKEYFRKSTVNLEKFLKIALQMATAINDLHKSGILHQQLRTEAFNYLPQTETVKMIDPDPLLRARSPIANIPNDKFHDVRVTRRILPYISPEQTGRMSLSSDYRTDLYSLGIIYYELLTGKPPFLSEDPFEIIHAHIARQPVPVSKTHPDLPTPVADIIMKLLEKNPSDRYQSVYGLLTDLGICLREQTTKGAIASFALAQNDIPEAFRQPQKLYGRKAEIEKLMNGLEHVIKGHGVFLIVTGYAGIGKSCLVNELQKPVAKSGGNFISGKYDQYHHDVPYSAIIQAFQNMINMILTENKESIELWKEKLLDAVEENGQVMIDVIPEVEFIIGKQPEIVELPPEEAQNRLMLVFLNFIKAFTQKERPLAIFLDDLQWADSASLKLIGRLSEFHINHFYFIGAYRNNEIGGKILLSQTLEAIQSREGLTETVLLSPLAETDVCRFTADTFNQNTEAVSSLSETIFAKTGGNPFFINQFLELLHMENIFSYDYDNGIWRWEIERIRAKDITDNVVDLLSQRIQKLDEHIQDTLQIAACIGDRFDIGTISRVSRKAVNDIASTLWEAQNNGFIEAVGNASQLVKNRLVSEERQKEINSGLERMSFKFIHDRMRQTVYSRIDDRQKKETHLEIGRSLMEAVQKDRIEENIFDIVNQLNLGIELLKRHEEFSELARTNLIAGKKAKSSAAYDSAYNYLVVGIMLLNRDSWQEQYALTLELHEDAAEAAYLTGRFREMGQLAEAVLKKVKPLLDRINIYNVQISALKAQNKLPEALKLGLSILRQLRFPLPEKPHKLHSIWALATTRLKLVNRRIEDFVDMPEMTDPYTLAIIRIGSNVASAAYYSVPDFLPLFISTALKLSMTYGNAPGFPFTYAGYGFILCGFLQDIDTGYRFGNLALKALKRSKVEKFRARTLFTVNAFIKHWKDHAGETLAPLKEAYQTGLKTGDLEYAALSAQIYPEYLFFVGKKLPGIEKELTILEKSMMQIKQETNLNHNRICRQTILNLMKGVDTATDALPWNLEGQAYSEKIMLPVHLQANDRSVLSMLYNFKIILCFMFQAYPQAVAYADKAERYIDGAVGLMNVPLFYFYDSLARLAVYEDVSASEQKRILKKIAFNQKKMKKWANHAPMNYLHKYYLVEAERARLNKKSTQAPLYYEKSIVLAKENGYIHEEALAYELTAKYYLFRKMQNIATVFFNEACQRYAQWGADAVVDRLKNKFAELFIGSTPQPAGNLKPLHLDSQTVIHTLQAISTDIILESLLKNLMKILMETAGASRILFLSISNHRICVEAEVKTENTDVTLFNSSNLEAFPDFILMPVLNYVNRTAKYITIEDVENEATFSSDPYFLQHKPKSILCLPVLKQSELKAILYFENNVTTGAFTRDRIEILQLLSSQIAISFENARLYDNLIQMEGELSKRLEIEQIIAAISSSFIDLNPHQIDNGIDNVLKILGEFSNEDRCYIFQISPDEKYIDETNAWYASDVESLIEYFQRVPIEKYPWFKNKLENNEIVHIPHLDDLPSEAIEFKSLLKQHELHSFLMVPMVYAGKPIGFLGISAVRHEKKWDDDHIRLLRTVSEILASACARKNVEVAFQLYQQQLRSLSSELVLTEERERRSIAIELHDRIGHALANAMIKLGSIRKSVNSAILTKKLEEINTLIDECIKDTRSLTFDLSPHILYDMGLEAAVDWLVEKMSEEYDIHMEFQDDMLPKPLDDSQRILIYQAIRELLFNIVKHAHAKTAKVTIERNKDVISVVIEDDGIGIDFTENNPYGKKSGGFGLFSIRERLNSQDGSFEIESASGSGTRITMSFPISKHRMMKAKP